MAKTVILDPTPEAPEPIGAAYPYVKALSGKKIGFASSDFWVCLDTIWKTLGDLLPVRSGVASTSKTYVPMSEPAPSETLDALARNNDAVIVALAGGGAGGAWMIHDTIELVKRKAPAVALVHEDFVSMSELIARSRGVPNLRFVVMPRDINAMPAGEIRAATTRAYDEIVKLLTSPG